MPKPSARNLDLRQAEKAAGASRYARPRDGHASRSTTLRVGMFAYPISHDAHHRGQICARARQLGHPLPKLATIGM